MLAPLWLLALAVIGVIAVWTGDALLTLAVVLALLVSSSLLLWQHYCLAGVSYRRRLSAGRAMFGETIELTTELINLKPLPLTWLQVDDVVPRGLRIDGGTMRAGRTDLTHCLTMIVAMLPYQRVLRRMQVRCTRRGELVFGPASLESGDYLGTLAKHERQSGLDHLIVYPKIFRVRLGRLPSNRILGRDAARRNFLTDPVRTIGTREYTHGDPYRSIDWRASARRDTLMVRVSEPSTTPILDIVLNFQTATSGWDSWEHEGMEFAISVAASLAAHGAERGWAIGIRGNGYSGGMPIDIRPSAAAGQFRTVLETLARATIAARGSLPSMLSAHNPRVPAGATLLLITTMLDAFLRATLRDLQRRGRAELVLQIARGHDASPAAPAAQAAMEAVWFYAWVMVLTPPGSTYPVFGAIVALMVMAALLGHASASLLRRRSRNHILLLSVSLVVLPVWLLAVLGPGENWQPRGWADRATALLHDAQPGTTALVTFGALGLAAWCRGLWLGAVPAGTDALRRRFLGGAAALVALSALLSLGKGTGVARFTDSLQLLVLGYFIIAPVAIALEHVQTLGRRATAARPVSLAWIVALLVPITAIVAVGLLLCNGVAPALGWVMHVAAQAILLLWLGFVWALHGLGVVLYWLASLFPFAWRRAPQAGGPEPIVLPPWQQPYAFSDPISIPWIVPTVLLVLLAVLFVYFLARRSRSSPAEHVDEERSSLWSWQLFRDQFMTAWRALLDRFRARGKGVFGAAPQWHSTSAKVMVAPGTGDIREIYRRLLRWAAANGHTRRPATTPNELQRELLGAMPMASAAVELITQNYECARYGDVAIEDAAIAASQAASEHLDDLQPD